MRTAACDRIAQGDDRTEDATGVQRRPRLRMVRNARNTVEEIRLAELCCTREAYEIIRASPTGTAEGEDDRDSGVQPKAMRLLRTAAAEIIETRTKSTAISDRDRRPPPRREEVRHLLTARTTKITLTLDPDEHNGARANVRCVIRRPCSPPRPRRTSGSRLAESLRTNRSISATTQMAKRGSASAAISSTERARAHLYAIHSDKDLHTLLGKYGLLDDGDDGPSARTFDSADDSSPRVRLAVLNRAARRRPLAFAEPEIAENPDLPI